MEKDYIIKIPSLGIEVYTSGIKNKLLKEYQRRYYKHKVVIELRDSYLSVV